MRRTLSRVLVCVLFVVGCGDDDPLAGDAGSDVSTDRSGGTDRATPGEDGAGSDVTLGADTPGVDGGTPSGDRYFPEGSWMYTDISAAAVHSESSVMTAWLEENGGWGLGRMQIDFSIEVLEADETPRRSFTPTGDFFDPDCDNVPVPVPAGGALEGESGYRCDSDGDCHLIVVDREAGELFEMWRGDIDGDTFNGGCLAVWDMNRVYPPEARGEQCSSADAAGFPIAPLLFYPEEVAAGEINHAIRFILPNARMRADLYTRPGSHAGGPRADGAAPVYGGRWRLRADFDLGSLPNEGARTVARALQRYGMALADGGNVALTAASDRFRETKWEGLLEPRDLDAIQPSDFEVLDTGPNIDLTYDCVRTP